MAGDAADLELSGPPPGDQAAGGPEIALRELRGPWPARDDLFDLDPPAAGAGVLVTGGTAAARADVAARLTALGHRADSAERLTRAALEASAVVVLIPHGDALPAQAMCVLAARRTLVSGPLATTFGLQPGIQFLHPATPDETVEQADSAARFPEATRMMRAVGRVAAESHRASLVYGRLASELGER